MLINAVVNIFYIYIKKKREREKSNNQEQKQNFTKPTYLFFNT